MPLANRRLKDLEFHVWARHCSAPRLLFAEFLVEEPGGMLCT